VFPLLISHFLLVYSCLASSSTFNSHSPTPTPTPTPHTPLTGLIHGDIKPLNIVRMGAQWKLIDLESTLFL
jgi:hypothetical protein